jgi:hypothetical protein
MRCTHDLESTLATRSVSFQPKAHATSLTGQGESSEPCRGGANSALGKSKPALKDRYTWRNLLKQNDLLQY